LTAHVMHPMASPDGCPALVLNADFRGKPQPTNVLSWPSEERGAEFVGEDPERPLAGTADEPCELGDIALAWDTCAREAAEQGARNWVR